MANAGRLFILIPRLMRRLSIVAALAATVWIASAESESSDTTDTEGINWVKEKDFWSFRLPVKQSLPSVRNSRWPRQPLDYFILARLEEKGLAPAVEAEKRTLIRRLTVDLTGLPPQPSEVEAFLKDRRPDSIEKLVDRLLSSPRFGEHMASLWLPLARYAEDQAHQVGNDTKSFYPNAYKYREWVINAFNRDLSYDNFIKLQLAADKFAPENSDDQAALGFIGLGPKYYNRNRLDVMAEEWEDRVDTVARSFLGLTVACARCHDHKFDPITTRDYYAMAGVFASTKMINKLPNGQVESETNKTSGAQALHIVADDKIQDLNVFIRGNVERKGPEVPRRFLRVLSDGEPIAFADGSGRKDLALAIASRHNPLTARVMVNRVWALLLGRPLVASPSNFGHSGEKPSHPELLDDLAVRFMDQGWSIKSLVREIVLSSTYRQDSAGKRTRVTADPGNDFFSRMNRKRLTVEQWRDSVLFAAGNLDASGGASLELDDPANLRRTVYARVSRLKLNDLLMQFDYPDANVHAEKRAVTTTALQKLFLMNNPFMLSEARLLAARVEGSAKPAPDDRKRIEQVYSLLFARPPESVEIKLGLEFLRRPAEGDMSRWEEYAQLLLASNEMMYLD